MHHPTCISKKDWESSLVYEKLMCRLHICSSQGGGSAAGSIYSTFCKRETERCLQQQHPPVWGGRGDAEGGPDWCLRRGRRASGLQRGCRSLTARWGVGVEDVRPVALCKPSGEQPPRASPCFHLTEAPRRLMRAWRRVARAAAGRIMGVHAQLDMRSHTNSKVHTRPQSGYFQDHLIKSQWVRLTHREVLCCLYGHIDSVQCFG